MHKSKRIVFLIIGLLCLIPQLFTEDSAVTGKDLDSSIIAGPEPFSLDSESAVYCINLLKQTPFIEIRKDSISRIIKVDTIWSLFLGYEEDYPAGHRRRYDIIVNGEALDWNNSFIEYGNDMLNMHLLFLYRNQHPPEGLEYRRSF